MAEHAVSARVPQILPAQATGTSGLTDQYMLTVQDLLNNNNATTIQITNSGSCKDHIASDALCTDLTHFVLDYAAFEKLAHPGYGVMNLQMRSAPQPCLF